MNNTISTVIETYAASPYNRNYLHNANFEDIQFTIDNQMLFEMILLEIRGMTVPFASHRKKSNNEKYIMLENQIKVLDNLVQDSNSNMLREMLEEKQK